MQLCILHKVDGPWQPTARADAGSFVGENFALFAVDHFCFSCGLGFGDGVFDVGTGDL